MKRVETLPQSYEEALEGEPEQFPVVVNAAKVTSFDGEGGWVSEPATRHEMKLNARGLEEGTNENEIVLLNSRFKGGLLSFQQFESNGVNGLVFEVEPEANDWEVIEIDLDLRDRLLFARNKARLWTTIGYQREWVAKLNGFGPFDWSTTVDREEEIGKLLAFIADRGQVQFSEVDGSFGSNSGLYHPLYTLAGRHPSKPKWFRKPAIWSPARGTWVITDYGLQILENSQGGERDRKRTERVELRVTGQPFSEWSNQCQPGLDELTSLVKTWGIKGRYAPGKEVMRHGKHYVFVRK